MLQSLTGWMRVIRHKQESDQPHTCHVRRQRPLSISHSFVIRLRDATTACVPEGCTAMAVTGSVSPGNVLATAPDAISITCAGRISILKL